MKNYLPRIPLVRLLIPFVSGILISYSFHFSIGIFIGLALIFISIVFLFLQRRFLRRSLNWIGFDGIIISFSLMILGIVLTSQEMNPGRQVAMNNPEKISAIHARLLNDPVVKEKSVKLIVDVKSQKDSLSWNVANEKMLVYLAREDAAEKLHYGDEILIHATPNAISAPKNPEEFDYRAWLERQGVRKQAYGKSGAWKIVGRGMGNWFKSAALDLRRYYLGKLREYGLNGSAFGVAAALLLGASDHLDPGTIQSYSASGTLHVLSVSGMHVALIYVVLLKLLAPMERRRGGKFLSIFLQLIFLWFYATLTGLCPSVLRSVTMLSVVIAGRAFNKNSHILNSLAASALILLVMDPLLIFDIGFQLSYLAVGGIVTLQPKLENLWEPNSEIFFGKIQNHLWTLISVTLVAQVFTFPLGLYYFQQFPTYFLLSNLLVIPLSTIVMYVGLVLLICSPITFIAKPIAVLFGILLELLNAAVSGIEHLPYSVIHSAKWEKPELFLLYVFIISILVFIIRKKKRIFQFGLASFLFLLLGVGCQQRKLLRTNELVIFNINHSSAIGVVNGSEFVLFADTSLIKRTGDIDFHIEPFLKAKKLELGEIIPLQDSMSFKNNFVHQGENFLMACGKKIAIVGRNFNRNENFPCDILVLKDNSNVKLEVLIEKMKPELIVADCSNKKWKIQKWEQICKKAHLKFYNVQEQGALVIKK